VIGHRDISAVVAWRAFARSPESPTSRRAAGQCRAVPGSLNGWTDNSPLGGEQLRPHHQCRIDNMVGSGISSVKFRGLLLQVQVFSSPSQHATDSRQQEHDDLGQGTQVPGLEGLRLYQACLLFLNASPLFCCSESWHVLFGSVTVPQLFNFSKITPETSLQDAKPRDCRRHTAAAGSRRSARSPSLQKHPQGALGSRQCLPPPVPASGLPSRVWGMRQWNHVRECLRAKLDVLPGFDRLVTVLLQRSGLEADVLRKWIWTWVNTIQAIGRQR
jgi:hypothetical protein